MPNDCASFDQAGNPRSSASMPRSALGDKDRGSRRDKNWAARPPGNIKSRPTNPVILTTYEGMHYDAVSSITAMIVLCCSRAVRDLLASKGCDMGCSIGIVEEPRECHNPHRSPPYHLHKSGKAQTEQMFSGLCLKADASR